MKDSGDYRRLEREQLLPTEIHFYLNGITTHLAILDVLLLPRRRV
ncbi:hypothetical protein CLV82_1193 [Zeaxanthinibacter enoshimensis]|uniref:Uncharacterized protein n=1 Tax=Zeaxanthinibacter enoshimensis TaxID=392009 RepID=A0A4R6TP44_9FLAO|nr:hypothetical protein CLV82_1193 [Zeaxanthinibacter enoshimensis]